MTLPVSTAATTAEPTPREPATPALRTITIEPWPDPVIDTVGHDPRSAYVERFWLGVLGPTTVLLFRRLAVLLDGTPEGFSLDLSETAATLGLSGREHRHADQSPIIRSLVRSCTFGVARAESPNAFVVRRRFPPLTRRQLERLPAVLRGEHRQWTERDARRPVAAESRRRARHLARSLVELGESYDAVERQLHHWKFHPAVAHDAVKWAYAERLVASDPTEVSGPASETDG